MYLLGKEKTKKAFTLIFNWTYINIRLNAVSFWSEMDCRFCAIIILKMITKKNILNVHTQLPDRVRCLSFLVLTVCNNHKLQVQTMIYISALRRWLGRAISTVFK